MYRIVLTCNTCMYSLHALSIDSMHLWGLACLTVDESADTYAQPLSLLALVHPWEVVVRVELIVSGITNVY